MLSAKVREKDPNYPLTDTALSVKGLSLRRRDTDMTETFDCAYCEESFDSKQGLRIHEGYNHDLPYKDEETMRQLYVDECKSINQIAEEFDVGSTTIEQWINKHGIETRDSGGKANDAAYKDPDTLRELYVQEELTRAEMAERLDCTMGDVRYHMEKHDIMAEARPWRNTELLREKCEEECIPVSELAEMWDCGETTLYYHMDKHDIERPRFAKEKPGQTLPYSVIYHRENGQNHYVFVHRLVACAHGMIEPSEVYSGDTDIHHKNGIVEINSPENLQALSPEEHQKIHAHKSANSSSVY